MQNNYTKQTLEQKMMLLCKKWEGKDEKYDKSMEHCQRIIDRIQYKSLKEMLDKIGENGKIGEKASVQDSFELAKQVFEIR